MRRSSRVAAAALWLAVGARTAAAQAPAQAPDSSLYREHCRTCHGTAGVPSQRMLTLYRTLSPFDSAFFAGRSDDSLVAVMRTGIGQMKSFSEKLTPDQMLAVARFIRTLASSVPPPKAP